MADINTELETLQNAVYGEEVRNAIIDGMTRINTESEETYEQMIDYRGMMESSLKSYQNDADLIKSNFNEWYQKLQVLFEDDAASNLATAILAVQELTMDTVESHRNHFRGKYLGNELTEEQFDTIAEGKFNDLFIGDYWLFTDTSGAEWTFRIVDFDYWYGASEESDASKCHHVVVMPDEVLDASIFIDDDNSAANYPLDYFSEYHSKVNAFTESIYELTKGLITYPTYMNYLMQGHTYKVDSIYVYNEKDIPNSHMMLGRLPYEAMRDVNIVYDNRTFLRQFALFKYAPKYIGTSEIWTKDVLFKEIDNDDDLSTLAIYYSVVGGLGDSEYYQYTAARDPYTEKASFRPVFAIGMATTGTSTEAAKK